jgi:hypothetical protein
MKLIYNLEAKTIIVKTVAIVKFDGNSIEGVSGLKIVTTVKTMELLRTKAPFCRRIQMVKSSCLKN